ncbi:carbohydrate ABC transporter permease [Gracilibacillus sp. YIM 98692]|uniref:carbohydrate ABC transporter permease n=1 Tax=Gracilibacillus sp. YIM 98692 TaxID=2663532 RepID=UPI0013D5DD3A|nr:carbohydrate ABC transporter permease [Gracilibacillus sp. YIM 98692]
MKKQKRTDLFIRGISYLFLIAILFFALFPAFWMFATSIKPETEIFTNPPRFFTENPSFSGYKSVIFESDIPRAFINSLVVSIGTTFFTLVLSVFAAYGFARFKFRGSGALSTGLLFGQMMPTVVIVMPLFMMFSEMSLVDNYGGLILANMAVTIPLGVIMLRSFFITIPKELDEAALIDGTSHIGALFRIILPNAIPGVVAVSIYTFLHSWEEFLFALILTRSSSSQTLPIAVNDFSGEFVIDWSGLMSASVVVCIPVLLLFLLCNKYFVKGLSEGSVKG